ncbi:putative pectinesterase 48 -like protein [Gossypium arboreum]|uniref:Putative pectinesterase 48-like protein n=1 Tax=Gossypium arboreum TaxID=29729 RepID=A0A0B0PE05_GOSAR|nr:putative pectinesterase 48 -like protein [Gossypium arboreum]
MGGLPEQRRTYFWEGLEEHTVYYGEYKCTGKGTTPATREKFGKQLSDTEAQTFLVLDYVEGTKWLRPPPTVPN